MEDNVNRISRQATDWESAFVKGTPEKGLLPRIHKEVLKLEYKKTNSLIRKMDIRL